MLLALPEVNRGIGRIWDKHLDGKYARMRLSPILYYRVCMGICAGYSKSQLSVILGGGWEIIIRSFVKVGFAKAADHQNQGFEYLVLSYKGTMLFNDFNAEIERVYSTLPKPKFKPIQPAKKQRFR
jgi:hypothetical protein